MTVREDPSKYVGDNVTKEWQEYRDAQNKKHAEERARTVRDDPGRYTDPNNRNGWYAGGIPVTPGDTNAIKATQKMLGIPQTGIWDKKTNNAYQLWKGKQGGANGNGVGYNIDGKTIELIKTIIPDARFSTDGKKMFIDGNWYAIASIQPSKSGTYVSAGWETIGIPIQYVEKSFDWTGVGKMQLNGQKYDVVQTANGNVLYAPTLGSNRKAATLAALQLIMDAVQIGMSTQVRSEYSVVLQAQNRGTAKEQLRAVIKVGSNKDRQFKGTQDTGVWKTLSEASRNAAGTYDVRWPVAVQDTARTYYEKLTGKKTNPKDVYDFEMKVDKEYTENDYLGTMMLNEKGELVYVPDMAGISIRLVTPTGKYDITDYVT